MPVLLKLGGSLITDKRAENALRPRRLSRLAREIASAVSGGVPVVLGHGSGSFGHAAAAGHGVSGPIETPRQRAGVALTRERAAALHDSVLTALRRAGLTPFSIPPGACCVSTAGRITKARFDALIEALDQGFLPVVYGDVCADRAWGAAVVSTEAVLLAVERALRRARRSVDRAVWAGDTAGILDGRGRTIPFIDPAAAHEARRWVGGSEATDVTGGMRHRLDSVLKLARRGVTSTLIDGRKRDAVAAALAGGSVEGTVVG